MKQCIAFWRPHEADGFLGNWFPAPISADGLNFATSEHYFMYRKAMLMGDAPTGMPFPSVLIRSKHQDSSAKRIALSQDPKDAKRYGQQVAPWNEALWMDQREQLMYEACLLKFQQNADLKEQLIKTGDALLVEASPMDRIWGVGMRASDAGIENPGKWKGLNLLGKALTRVREKVLKEQHE